MTSPCPLCKGKGWFETGLYGLENDPQPCPECNPVIAPTRGELAALAVCLLALIALIAVASW